LTIRVRLVMVVVALLASGLLVADLVAVAALRSYLLDRVDETISMSEPAVLRVLSRDELAAGPAVPSGGFLPPSTRGATVYAARVDGDGETVAAIPTAFLDSENVLSDLPSDVIGSLGADARRWENVTIDDARYRLLVQPIGDDGDVAVIASPLDDVEQTLARLTRLFVVVGSVVLLGAVGMSLWLVRIGVRPLRNMALTASAIAGGETSRRIAITRDDEVGRLGRALNDAFDARQSSEDTLRSFVADASHELRTPLASIRGYSELLRSGAAADAESMRKAAQRIETESTRMAELVDDLLLLARLDQGRPLREEVVDVTDLVSVAVDDARAAAPDRTVRLRSNGDYQVVGDSDRLHQIVSNLLNNTRDHTPPGTVVDVWTSAGKDAVEIHVQDDGPGMTPEDAAHAFERFWRARPDRPHEQGRNNSGLGLSIVQALAVAHGGTARLEASKVGSHVVVALPRTPRGA
jgi:two-component system OmpR family sensor kinase